MADPAASFQLLYISRLAPDFDFNVVKKIVNVARRTNPEQGVTGALLFDGERFCQLLEGSESEVRALMNRIEADVRHARVRLLHCGVSSTGVLMQRWCSGYCDAHDLDALDSAAETALSPIGQFLAVLTRADIF